MKEKNHVFHRDVSCMVVMEYVCMFLQSFILQLFNDKKSDGEMVN